MAGPPSIYERLEAGQLPDEIPEFRRYWVVRADSGYYYEHFVSHGLIAVGFLDEIATAKVPASDLRTFVKEHKGQLATVLQEQNRSKVQIENHFAQVSRFADEMEPGDWVICLSQNFMSIGRLIGHAYLDPAEKTVRNEKGEVVKEPLTFALRRRVIWGPQFERRALPGVLRNALYAHLTVFSVDPYWREINHLVYPIFRSGDNLFFSLQIGTQNGVDNFLVSQLFEYLSELEAAIRLGDNLPDNDAEFSERVLDLAIDNRLTLETKAQYFSPGVVWGSLGAIGIATAASQSYIAAAILVYLCVFGTDGSGILDLKTRQRFFAILLDRWEKKRGQQIKSRLQVSVPKANTETLENSAKDEDRPLALPAPKPRVSVTKPVASTTAAKPRKPSKPS